MIIDDKMTNNDYNNDSIDSVIVDDVENLSITNDVSRSYLNIYDSMIEVISGS